MFKVTKRFTGGRTFLKCIICEQPFTKENVTTASGWRETQISGYCEDCFDDLFVDDEDIDDDEDTERPF